eukprot:388189-Pelagomonas_calceolata.AAC.3
MGQVTRGPYVAHLGAFFPHAWTKPASEAAAPRVWQIVVVSTMYLEGKQYGVGYTTESQGVFECFHDLNGPAVPFHRRCVAVPAGTLLHDVLAAMIAEGLPLPDGADEKLAKEVADQVTAVLCIHDFVSQLAQVQMAQEVIKRNASRHANGTGCIKRSAEAR